MSGLFTSAGNLPTTAPYAVCLDNTLSDFEQETASALLRLLPADCIHIIAPNHEKHTPVCIKKIVDGRGLACPMPLLKAKVALREVTVNDALYLIATDPNAQTDIMAFCLHTQHNNQTPTLQLIIHQATSNSAHHTAINKTTTAACDTIFHFIITKTDSN